MTAVPFDTLKYAQKLCVAGIPAEQAAGMAQAFTETVNLANIVTEPLLRSELERFELRMTVRMGVIAAASIGLLLTLERLLPPAG